MNSQELTKFVEQIDACLKVAMAEFELGPDVAPIKHNQEMAKVRESLQNAKNFAEESVKVCQDEEARIESEVKAAAEAEAKAKAEAEQKAKEEAEAALKTDETVNP